MPEGLILPQAEALIAATGADFRIGGNRAFYSPTQDFVQVPRPDAYFESSTGTGPRSMNLVTGPDIPHDSCSRPLRHVRIVLYAKESLVAEMISVLRVRIPPRRTPTTRFLARGAARGQPRHRAGREPATRRPTTFSASFPDPQNPMLARCGPGEGGGVIYLAEPTSFASMARAAQRGRGQRGFRDGLEVEREAFGRPSRRLRDGSRHQKITLSTRATSRSTSSSSARATFWRVKAGVSIDELAQDIAARTCRSRRPAWTSMPESQDQ